MNLYEQKVSDEIKKWQHSIFKKTSVLEKASKTIQTKTQKLVPQKVQNMLTKAIKKMVETIMFGSNILTVKEDTSGLSLAERDLLVLEKFKTYKQTAIVQGASFGAGGLLLGLSDFPALLSIKVKFLFDAARLYGFDTTDKNERLYMLYVFQIAFSSDEQKREIYNKIVGWDEVTHTTEEINWEKFQIEYRDYIDLVKIFQLLPIVGSVAGAAANYRLMDTLYENTKNCYRMRILSNQSGLGGF